MGRRKRHDHLPDPGVIEERPQRPHQDRLTAKLEKGFGHASHALPRPRSRHHDADRELPLL
jgi:hypothetical protein